MFLSMEMCKWYNNADNNPIINSYTDLNRVILNMKHYCQNAIKTNSNTFQFKMICSKLMEPQIIELYGDVSITPESSVKLMGVVIDDRSNCHEHIKHISMCCTVAALQSNTLAWKSKHFDFKSKINIYNSFIFSNLATAGKPGTSVIKRIIRSQISCKSGHCVYCVVIIFLIFKTSWRIQMSR